MAEHVEVNYETLKGVQATFAQQADDITMMYRKLMSQVDSLRGGNWIGKGADAFYSEMEGDVLPAVQRLIHAMQQADAVVGQISQEFQAAEEETKSVWA